jgi:hypothetical protein
METSEGDLPLEISPTGVAVRLPTYNFNGFMADIGLIYIRPGGMN